LHLHGPGVDASSLPASHGHEQLRRRLIPRAAPYGFMKIRQQLRRVTKRSQDAAIAV
jgi:hypothetical protein